MTMDKALWSIIRARYEKLAGRVVHRLRRYPAKDWNCDASNMRTLWDHWKREMQEEHSVFHGLIEDMVEQIARDVVDGLAHEEGALLTLGTDALDDLDEEPGEPVFDPQAVAAELMRYVNQQARNEPHRREVQRALVRQDLDRFERDNEPYR